MVRYVLIRKFCELSGYTEKAVRQKIANGVWIKGHVWHKAPDGHILIDLEGYDRWARGEDILAASRLAKGTRSPSGGRK